MRLYTVGHSSRKLHEFVDLLRSYGIELLVDVRSYPKSSRFPHFGKEVLKVALEKEGIAYIHIPALGGMRKVSYREYMKSEEFRNGIAELIKLSGETKTAFMCAEKDWRGCHRRFIAKALVRKGIEVIHILDTNRAEQHPKHLFPAILY